MISAGAKRVLELLKAAEDIDNLDDAEIVCEGRVCYVGLKTISKAKVFELLRLVLIRDNSNQGGGLERYSLNEEGRKFLANPTYVPQIVSALRHRDNN